MSSLIKIIILAIIQGITEFLPISSSGHLVIGKALFGFESPGVGLELSLHFGTLIAIIVFYRHDLRDILRGFFAEKPRFSGTSSKMLSFILLATVPVGVLGVIFNNSIEPLFADVRFVGTSLFVTGAILISTAFFRRGGASVGLRSAIIVGLAQAVAILPGISRSGATISVARMIGIEPDSAARFSFLIAIPAIAGAIVYELIKYPADFQWAYISGIAISAVVGYYSLKLLINIVRSDKLWVFGPYCLILGLAVVLFMK